MDEQTFDQMRWDLKVLNAAMDELDAEWERRFPGSTVETQRWFADIEARCLLQEAERARRSEEE